MPAKLSPKRCRIWSPRWWRLTTAASQPIAASCCRVCPRMGIPATGSNGLGETSVRGRSRVPSPAASTRALRRLVCMGLHGPAWVSAVPESHLGRRVRMGLQVVLVETQIGAPLGLVGVEAAALRHHLGAVALELGEVADRGVVESDRHAAEVPLLPHLLVAADDGEAQVFEQGARLLGIFDLDLVL